MSTPQGRDHILFAILRRSCFFNIQMDAPEAPDALNAVSRVRRITGPPSVDPLSVGATGSQGQTLHVSTPNQSLRLRDPSRFMDSPGRGQRIDPAIHGIGETPSLTPDLSLLTECFERNEGPGLESPPRAGQSKGVATFCGMGGDLPIERGVLRRVCLWRHNLVLLSLHSDSLTWKWMVPWKTTFLCEQGVFHFHVKCSSQCIFFLEFSLYSIVLG